MLTIDASEETLAQEACFLRMCAALVGALMCEGMPPAEDMQSALQAVRAALDSARRLRYARGLTAGEHQTLVRQAAQARIAQEEALRRWYQSREINLEPTREIKNEESQLAQS